MSWLISFGVVLLIILVISGIDLLIDKFDVVLGWCYLIIILLGIGLLVILTIAVHKTLF